jgi:hypothetical protein
LGYLVNQSNAYNHSKNKIKKAPDSFLNWPYGLLKQKEPAIGHESRQGDHLRLEFDVTLEVFPVYMRKKKKMAWFSCMFCIQGDSTWNTWFEIQTINIHFIKLLR